MKKLFLIPVFSVVFFFSSCIQSESIINYIVGGSFEDSGTIVNESQYFAGGKKTSDWLLVMYMDADVEKISSLIRLDFNEVEQGLAAISNSSDYDSVRVVVLWDGTQLNDTRIFELGPDSAANYLAGSKTYNIQNLGNFTDSQGTAVNMSKFNSKEVDMSQGETLTTFLKWVDCHYTSTKGKILHIADHGSGPGKNTRSMCSDLTSKTAPMASSEFSSALYNAGYGHMKNNKYSALLLDVCLGSSFEDAYQFRNSAEYMIASPNLTPGAGFDYVGVLKSFKSGVDLKTLSKNIGKSFAKAYEKSAVNSIGTSATVTVIDLAKVYDCAEKIDALASSVKSDKETYRKYLMYDGTTVNNLWYKGTINWLFDIGYFALKIQNDGSSTETIINNAKALKEKLESCIVYSWRYSMYDYETQPAYSALGITICGGMNDGSTDLTYGIPSWYTTELDFGRRTDGWADLLKEWFGTGFRGSY